MAKNARFNLNTVEGLTDAVSELLSEVQRKRDFVRAAPNLQEIDEGEIVPYLNGATIRFYTKINGVLYYVALTAA